MTTLYRDRKHIEEKCWLQKGTEIGGLNAISFYREIEYLYAKFIL
jgi:hypothetical protein